MGWVELATVVALAGVASFAQALSGFGFSLLLVPPLALVVGPKEAVVMANLMGMMSSSLTLTSMHEAVDWRLGLRLLGSAAVGMVGGLFVLIVVDPKALQIGIAVLVLVATTLIWRGIELRAQNRGMDLAAGLLSGVLNTSTSMSGPPLVLYLQNRGMTPGQFRATLNAFFLASGAIASVLFVLGDRIGSYELGAAAASTPLVALGWLLGHRMFYRLGAAQFRTVVVGVLFTSASIALVGALAK
ncbi:MAG: sulfite exporter TauE/SafE family protein [Tepidiformaceae bacterium]